MTSIIVISKPCAPAQPTISARSYSFTPFSATAFSLIANPAFLAASKPARTLSRSPQRVMLRNLSGSSVSIEILRRLTPASTNSSAILCNWLPFVVIVSSSRLPDLTSAPRLRINCMILRRTKGSPPVRRILRVPIAINLRHTCSSSSSDSSSDFGRNVISSAMQYTQRKSQRSVTDTRI